MPCVLTPCDGGGILLSFDGRIIQVSASCVQRSALLRQLLQDSACDESSTGECPIAGIERPQAEAWVRFREERNWASGEHENDMTIHDVAEALLVRFDPHSSCT